MAFNILDKLRKRNQMENSPGLSKKQKRGYWQKTFRIKNRILIENNILNNNNNNNNNNNREKVPYFPADNEQPFTQKI